METLTYLKALRVFSTLSAYEPATHHTLAAFMGDLPESDIQLALLFLIQQEMVIAYKDENNCCLVYQTISWEDIEGDE